MVHRGVLSCGGTEFGGPCHFTGEAPRFQAVRESGWLTQATSRSKTKGIRPKLAALARSHPFDQPAAIFRHRVNQDGFSPFRTPNKVVHDQMDPMFVALILHVDTVGSI